jgi:serine/threonine-protein kinase
MFDEARAMAAVEHPNLALIYGLEVWRRTPVLVVEYLPGGTLADRLRSGAQPLAAALEVGAQLCDAVAALHAHGVLHRDIKPSNVGFTRANVVKLLDFGVARFRDSSVLPPMAAGDEAQAATNTAVAGTPMYLPPEALAGAPPDRYVYLWAIATVVLEIILGRHPYASNGVLDVRRISGQVVPSRALARLPDDVRAFFLRALTPGVGSRPDSAAAMQRELTALHARYSINSHAFTEESDDARNSTAGG